MLPSSSFLSGAAGVVEVPPPQGFRELAYPLREVTFSVSNEFTRQLGNTAARENGLRYESQAHEHLQSVLGAGYLAVELHVRDAKGRRELIPDGVFFHPNHVVIFEVKSQHMPEAWWQLRKLYQPALRFKLPKRPVYVVEVCKSFDPAMPFPEEIVLINDLKDFAYNPLPAFGVYQWTQ